MFLIPLSTRRMIEHRTRAFAVFLFPLNERAQCTIQLTWNSAAGQRYLTFIKFASESVWYNTSIGAGLRKWTFPDSIIESRSLFVCRTDSVVTHSISFHVSKHFRLMQSERINDDCSIRCRTPTCCVTTIENNVDAENEILIALTKHNGMYIPVVIECSRHFISSQATADDM